MSNLAEVRPFERNPAAIPQPASARRELALDSLRGFASIGVLLWHYSMMRTLEPYKQPFYDFFLVPYNFGSQFVEFFFCLSGFIFFAKYFQPIANGTTKLREFVFLRLSRLYPLLILTLVVAAVLQYTYHQKTGNFYTHVDNGFFTFIAHFFFLHSDVFKAKHSFNGSAWSLGVEFWLYLVFFFVASRYKDRHILPAVLSILAFAAYDHGLSSTFPFTPGFERGISSFFLGGVIFSVCEFLKKEHTARTREIVGLASGLIFAVGIFLFHDRFKTGNKAYLNYEFLSATLILHPLAILAAMNSTWIGRTLSIRPFTFFGDISYAMYLWHMPVQLTIVNMAVHYGLKFHPGELPFYFTYFATVIGVSTLSTYLFEQPVQQFLRGRWHSARSQTA